MNEQTIGSRFGELKKIKTLNVNALHQNALYTREIYLITIDPNVTLVDVMLPAYWAHHTRKLKPRDLIEVLSGDLELDVTLRVLRIDVDGGLIDMRLHTVAAYRDVDAPAIGDDGELDPAAAEAEEPEPKLPDLPDGYEVKFIEARAWYVRWLAVEPPTIVSEGNESKLAAYEAAIDHAKRAKAA